MCALHSILLIGRKYYEILRKIYFIAQLYMDSFGICFAAFDTNFVCRPSFIGFYYREERKKEFNLITEDDWSIVGLS